jgi:DNA-directed RNA polymerase specialized sigma24 family protein
MRTDIPRPASDIGTPTAILLLFGTAMLLAGFFYPGRQAAAATTFIVAGAGMVAVGILLPRMREFEIGPGGFKTKMESNQPPQPLLDMQADKLTRFAYLVSGDLVHARELVEEALARSRQQQRRLPASERDMLAVRTLIELLDTIHERHWLRGSPKGSDSRADDDLPSPTNIAVVHALQRLSFPQRVAFLLRADWLLRNDEIATVLERPLETVDDDVKKAREVLRPYMDMETRAVDEQ